MIWHYIIIAALAAAVGACVFVVLRQPDAPRQLPPAKPPTDFYEGVNDR